MSRPAAFALDAAGNLYVSDTGNCRVLQFLQPFIDGESTSVVIGKPDADTRAEVYGESDQLGKYRWSGLR